MSASVANFEEVLTEVRERFGIGADLDEPRPLEQLILLVLSRGVSLRRARTAMRRLQDSYVDWNEVRVSSVYEIRKVLEPLGARGLGNKAEQIRDLLSTAYTRFNKLQLDFLTAGPLDADRSRRLDRFVKYLLTTLCPPEKTASGSGAKGAKTRTAKKTAAAKVPKKPPAAAKAKAPAESKAKVTKKAGKSAAKKKTAAKKKPAAKKKVTKKRRA